MDTIKINNITKQFKKFTALNDVSINISGTYGLLGPNGAGKTTLMRIIATLLNQTSGSITYNNIDWSYPDQVKRIIGYLPQHFNLYPTISVIECLNHLAVLKGITDKNQREQHINSLLNKVNLIDVKNKKIKNLSGGMLRRVGIAQALLGSPKIVIVDEPTAGLDIEERVRFRTLLRDIGKDHIVIISTHIVEDLEYTCDNLCVLKKGVVIFEGNRQEIANLASGYLWEIEEELETQKVKFIQGNFHVISTKKSNDDKYIFRFIADNPSVEGAYQPVPNLEDGYLLLMQDRMSYYE